MEFLYLCTISWNVTEPGRCMSIVILFKPLIISVDVGNVTEIVDEKSFTSSRYFIG
jgi:hypothetical protein